jgi:dolichol-phosphate mannosyltransferase
VLIPGTSIPVKDLLVLVCTYNEKQNLPGLFAGIDAAIPGVSILVVDDKSPDGTSEWVRDRAETRPNTFLMERSGKLGLGTAIREGMHYGMEKEFHWLLNLDADLSHDPSAMVSLLARAQDHDLVIGSRYVDGGGLKGCSWKRILVSRCANAYAKFMVGWKIQDCSSAYRLYRVAALRNLEWSKILGKGYGFLEEVLWHLLQQGNRWTEVGIIYTERQKGASKISIKEALSTISSLHRVAKLGRHSAGKKA